MKLSYIIEQSLNRFYVNADDSRNSVSSFMCYAVNLFLNSCNLDAGLKLKYRDQARRVIVKSIDHEFTLNGYLYQNNDEYRRIRETVEDYFESDEAFAIRCQHWQNVIAELKSKGK